MHRIFAHSSRFIIGVYAAKFDYFYVPTFYVGTEKLHEGVPSKEAIERVFAAAV